MVKLRYSSACLFAGVFRAPTETSTTYSPGLTAARAVVEITEALTCQVSKTASTVTVSGK